MSACEGPTSPAEHALQQWLTDVRAHSVAYAYTLLSQNSEQRTNYDAFFAGVDQSHASYTIVSAKVISANDVEVMVAVKNPGATQPTLVKVQVLEEGNGGDWLVGAPFSTKGANAILEFR
jgi:presenilin-like A22 family membrane protease